MWRGQLSFLVSLGFPDKRELTDESEAQNTGFLDHLVKIFLMLWLQNRPGSS